MTNLTSEAAERRLNARRADERKRQIALEEAVEVRDVKKALSLFDISLSKALSKKSGDEILSLTRNDMHRTSGVGNRRLDRLLEFKKLFGIRTPEEVVWEAMEYLSKAEDAEGRRLEKEWRAVRE